MRPKNEVQRATELKWLDGFGRISFFLKNDIRLIVRNKRARMAVWMGFAFLFYGLIFMMDIYDYSRDKGVCRDFCKWWFSVQFWSVCSQLG